MPCWSLTGAGRINSLPGVPEGPEAQQVFMASNRDVCKCKVISPLIWSNVNGWKSFSRTEERAITDLIKAWFGLLHRVLGGFCSKFGGHIVEITMGATTVRGASH